MDYYGYFPTFNSLIVESQIIATLIGFAAIFFIFWYNSKYRIATSYGKEKLTKEDTFELVIATIIFLVIIFIGIIVVINNASTLSTTPMLVEEIVAENPAAPLPDFVNDRLDFAHKLFLLWMFASFIYLVVLTLRLDIFDIFVEEENETKTKQKEKKTKRVKKNVGKNKKSSGGK